MALKFLQQQPPYTDAPRPDLIVLDINLPRENGFDVLRRIRQEPQLAAVPAVFFSTSNSVNEHRLSRDLGAMALVHKPAQLEQLEQFETAVQFMLRKVTR